MGVNLAVIGGGVMGRAVVEGGIRAGVLRADEVVVAEPDAGRRDGFGQMGCAVVGAAAEAVGRLAGGEGAAILLAVKPQMFGVVAGELRSAMATRLATGARAGGAASGSRGADEPAQRDERGVLAISIMAGVRASTIGEGLGAGVRVVRAMPNTPARVGQGVTGIAAGVGATPVDMERAERMFAALGPVVERIDESLMDAFTGVAGSGPAYLFYLAEAMERAAREVGFEADAARRVVAQTLRGAVALLDGSDPAALRAAVTSKGGTTAAAVGVLETEGVAEAWVRAITAARDRGRELSGQ